MSKSSFAQGQLRSIVERIERLEAEKADIGSDIKEVYAEAKGNGFDTKVLRKVIALRKLDAAEREEAEAVLDLYLQALGMQPELPFEAADETTASQTEAEAVATPETPADDFNEQPGAGPLPEHTKAA